MRDSFAQCDRRGMKKLLRYLRGVMRLTNFTENAKKILSNKNQSLIYTAGWDIMGTFMNYMNNELIFNKDTYSTNITTTVGDELIDLKKALDSGAINQEEYDAMKEKLLQRD